MIRQLLLLCLLGNICAYANCLDKFEIVSIDVIEAMQKTNSNWSAVDQSIFKVIKHGDYSVPFLALYLDTDLSFSYTEPGGWKKSRAMYILSQIGTKKAEALLVDSIGNPNDPDEIAVTSLAILNGEDVVENILIERSWYQHKYISGQKAALVWWYSLGKSKYKR